MPPETTIDQDIVTFEVATAMLERFMELSYYIWDPY